MARIAFYEKPGCQTNARQKALLAAAGHIVEARNLLAEPWTPERLRSFFGGMDVADWFNKAAPAVKSGAVDPAAITAEAALTMMVEDPLLIRRPLMETNGMRGAGFHPERMQAWLRPDDTGVDICLGGGESCPAPLPPA